MAAPLRVMVVEDDVDSAETLGILLRLWGYEPHVVVDGTDALREACAFKPDVVLLDIGLPGVTGYDVARALRAAGLATRLVAMTGYGQPEDRLRAKEAGFDEHVTKPVDPAVLQRVLNARG